MDATTLKCWRLGLLLILAIECVVLAYFPWSLQHFKPIQGGNPLFLGIVSNAWLIGPFCICTLVALTRYLGFSGGLHWGFLAVIGMKIVYECFATVYSAHRQGFYQSGAVLWGFVLGETYAFLMGINSERSPRESLAAQRFGAIAAIAIFGATYVAAGSSKVLYGGLSWMDSSTLRLMVASHTEVGTTSWKDAIGHWVTAHPAFCDLLQIGTIFIQLGGFMMTVSDRWRTVWASLIVLFHLGIYATSNILFLQPLFFAGILAFPWRSALRARDSDNMDPLPFESWDEGKIGAAQHRWGNLVLICVAALWLASPSYTPPDLWRHLLAILRGDS